MDVKPLRILIAGTPSVGKTTIAKKLADIINYHYVDVAKVVVENQLYKGKDFKRGSLIVDIKRAREFFSDYIVRLGNVVLDSHVVEIFPKRLVDRVIILRAHPLLIFKRCIERGWSLEKSLENAQAELLGVCLFDAIRVYGVRKVWQIDCTCRPMEDIISETLKVLRGKKRREYVDWLKRIESEEKLDLLLELEKARDLPKDFFELLGDCR
ncbi:MAG: adenylate kinase family protein [Candidatus Nezhaarchaeales archaeon]